MKIGRTIILTAIVSCVLSSPLFAQGPGPGGFQPSEQMLKKMKAWREWRTKHSHITMLEKTIMDLCAIENKPSTKLSKSQAKIVLSTIAPYRSKSAISDLQAASIIKRLKSILNKQQLKAIASMARMGGPAGPPPGGFSAPPPGGPGGSPPGRFGGPPPGWKPGEPPPAGFGPPPGGRPDGPPRMPVFPNPKDYNPLNPKTLPFEPMRQPMTSQLNNLIKQLKATK